jgi:hypothetical protein
MSGKGNKKGGSKGTADKKSKKTLASKAKTKG